MHGYMSSVQQMSTSIPIPNAIPSPNNDSDAIIVLATFIPLLIIMIASFCNDDSFEFEV